VAKALGQLWAGISAEEKQSYQDRAAEERARVAADLKAWQEAHGDDNDDGEVADNKDGSSSGTLVFPLARIRKICKLDPDVRGLSKEGLLLVTKAAELVTAKLGKETVRVAQIQNRRKLLPEDVAQVCSSREQFAFLREDIADLTRQQQKDNAAAAAAKAKNGEGGASSADKKEDGQPSRSNMKPLTAYFTAKPST